MSYDITYELAGIFIIFALLAIYIKSYKDDSKIGYAYISLIVVTIVYCFTDVISGFTISYYHILPYWVNYCANAVYYIMVALEGVFLWRYVRIHFIRVSMIWLFIESIPVAIYNVALLVFNPFTKWFFYIDEFNIYQRGPLYMVPNFICYGYYVLAYVLLFYERKRFSKKRIAIQHMMLTFSIFFIGFQLFFPQILMAGMAAVCTTFLSLFIFETPDYAKLQATLKELKKSEKEAAEAREEAELANKAKSAFLANMSHQIRTPLNAIIGLDEMILRESEETDIRSYALQMKNSGQALLGTVNDILDFSKIESGNLELYPENYDLVDVITVLVDMERERAEKKNLKFVVNIDETLPRYLYGDSIRLRQIITNILTNAVKYTEEGSVVFSIKGEVVGDELELYVEVKDTGIGIKEEDIPKLFMEFERIEENRNRSIEGTGLGMNITVSLLELMKSKLEVSSIYGLGSVFSFKVRQKIIENKPIGNIEEKLKEKAGEYTYKTSFVAPYAKVLAVDDKDLNLFVLKNLLKKTEVQIKTALSGKEAIAAAENEKFDLILLDHMMPEMDGIEVLHYLRDNMVCDSTPIVVLTANAMIGVEETYLAEGFDGYLSKPINQNDLEATLRKFINPTLVKEASEIAESDDGNESEADNEFINSIKAIEGLDYEAALNNFDSAEMFKDIFEQFAMSFEDNANAIRNLAKDLSDSEKIKNYRINAHSMKSSAKLVGLTMLSELSREAEDCAREEDVAGIEANLEKLLPELERVQNAISEFGTNEETDEGNEVEASVLLVNIQMLKSAADDFDMDLMDKTSEVIVNAKLPAECSEMKKLLKKAVMELDTDAIIEDVELIERIIKGAGTW